MAGQKAEAELKNLGYLSSIASVLLLAIVSVRQASTDPFLFGCLLAGAATSLLGIGLRWIVYVREQREKAR